MKIIVIEWLDAISRDGWNYDPEINLDESKQISVGIEIEKTKQYIKFAQSKGANDSVYGNVMLIPRKLILKHEYLNGN